MQAKQKIAKKVIYWDWVEAFWKFGFGDGTYSGNTKVVEAVLIRAGFTVDTYQWGMHNLIIFSIKKNGAEQIPARADLGYEHPRSYLPPGIIVLLDECLSCALPKPLIPMPA